MLNEGLIDVGQCTYFSVQVVGCLGSQLWCLLGAIQLKVGIQSTIGAQPEK